MALKVLPAETETEGTFQEPLTLVTKGEGNNTFEETPYPLQSKLTKVSVRNVLRKGVTTDERIVTDAMRRISHNTMRKNVLVFKLLRLWSKV